MKEGRIDYIVAIILSNVSEKSKKKELPLEISNYMRTFTYLDARTYKENIVDIRKRIRFAMPTQTLKELRAQKVCLIGIDLVHLGVKQEQEALHVSNIGSIFLF